MMQVSDLCLIVISVVCAVLLTLDCVGFPSICYTVAEYQRILSIQELGHLAFDCVLKQLSLCCLGSKNLMGSRKMTSTLYKSPKNTKFSSNVSDLREGELVYGHANSFLTALHGG